MKRIKFGAILLGLLAGAISTWFQPYNQLEIQGVDYRVIMSLTALVLSFFYKLWTTASTFTTGLYLAFGILLALVLRIIVDVIFRSVDHDLWPLEIAIFGVIAFPSSFIGAYLAELLQWSKSRS